jgi:hypothetical protein
LISESSRDLKYAAGESVEQDIFSIEEELVTDPEISKLKAEMKRLKKQSTKACLTHQARRTDS